MKTKIIFILTLATLFLVISQPIQADDTDLFSASTPPYVMFMLDTSYSMMTNDYKVENSDLTAFKSYTTWTGKTYTFTVSGNNNNYKATRIEALKRITIEVIDMLRAKIKFGVSTFFFPARQNYGSGATVNYGIADYSKSDAATKTSFDALTDFIKNYKINNYNGSGAATPLTESLDTLYGYFNNKISSTDGNTWTDFMGANRAPAASGYQPVPYSCVKTYVIFITDGKPTSDDNNDSYYKTHYVNLDLPAANKINFNNIYENDNASLWKMSKALYEKKPTNGTYTQDEGPITYTIGMALYPKDGNDDEKVVNLLKATAWGIEPSKAAITTAPLPKHDVPGEYLPGNNYAQLKQSILNILGNVSTGNFNFSAITSPSKSISAGATNPLIFLSYFWGESSSIPIWYGHLMCFRLVPWTSGMGFDITKIWDAADSMNSQFSKDASQRKIFADITTANNHVIASKEFVSANKIDFVLPLGVSATLNPSNPPDLVTADNVIKYIRGEDTVNRPKIDPDATDSQIYILGDPFHSDIPFIGDKVPLWKVTFNPKKCFEEMKTTGKKAEECPSCYESYVKFVESLKTKGNRTNVIYIGTNDGIMHTINAADSTTTGGQEISGYIPDEVLTSLKKISIPNRQHTYTTDGLIESSDIYCPNFTPSGTDPKWKSVMVFGLRQGGKAYYCRDITQTKEPQTTMWRFPAYIGSAKLDTSSGKNNLTGTTGSGFVVDNYVVNERRTTTAKITKDTAGDVAFDQGGFINGDKLLALPSYYKYMGQTWARPVIGRIQYKADPNSEDITESWVAILAGGFGDNTTSEGKGLFIVNAETGALIWMLAYDTTGTSDSTQYISNDATLNYSIPESITAIDIDNNRFLDTIYFANTGGNVFKIKISDPSRLNWKPEKIYIANTAGGNPEQPIYVPMAIVLDQCYKPWVYFGTGDRDKPLKVPADGTYYKFFGIRDFNLPAAGVTMTDLINLKDSTGKISGQFDPAVNKGWYIPFITPAERLFEPTPYVIPQFSQAEPYIFFNTYDSTIATPEDPCAIALGSMKIYEIHCGTCIGEKTTISGTITAGRIMGGGVIGNNFGLFTGTDNKVGPDTIPNHKNYVLPYVGGLIFWRENKN